jgi:hypothetical protein
MRPGSRSLCWLARIIWGAGLVFVAVLAVQAHERISTEITWSREISRVMDRRCLSCHHQGGMAFDLTAYERARPWAKAIKDEVLNRRMPPWGAVKGFADYAQDSALTQEEVNLIAEWVEGGAPAGEARELPEFTWESRRPAAPPRVDAEIRVEKNLTALTKDQRVVGIRPLDIAGDTSLRVVARRPDGSVEPLIWFDGFRPQFNHDYFFRRPLHLPAGSNIQLSSSGTIALLTAQNPAERRRPPREDHGVHTAPLSEIDGTVELTPEKLEELLKSGESPGLFVCPMDPDVRSDRPGACSRCGMKLVLGIPKRLEYAVDLETNPKAIQAGKDVELSFDVREPETDEPLYHFQLVHTKLLHLFVVGDDLEYFLHEHPVFGPDGVFRFKTRFPKPGSYRVLADFYPQGGAPQLAAKTVLVSEKHADLTLRSASLRPGMSPKTAANLEVELVTEPAQPIAGLKTLMFFRLKPAEGLEQYLGAWGHMLAASADMVDLIHNHPFLAYQQDGRVQFNMIFPRPGMYRVWVQFQRQGVVNTASFDIPVEELK